MLRGAKKFVGAPPFGAPAHREVACIAALSWRFGCKAEQFQSPPSSEQTASAGTTLKSNQERGWVIPTAWPVKEYGITVAGRWGAFGSLIVQFFKPRPSAEEVTKVFVDNCQGLLMSAQPWSKMIPHFSLVIMKP